MQCRKEYITKSSILECLQKEAKASTYVTSPLRSRMRSSVPTFDFKEYYTFCGEEASEQRKTKKSKESCWKIKHVSILSRTQ